jgi:hypothetical protein
MDDLKQSDSSSEAVIPGPDNLAGVNQTSKTKPSMTQTKRITHPSGKAGHGPFVKFLRGLAFTVYFVTCCVW